jgi:hypothetical protein
MARRSSARTDPPTTNVAVFGDVHGRVLMPFYLCGRWQEAHGEPIHLALCVGDLGIYRSFDHMEKTSQRWARKHPEELGFSKFFHALDLRRQKLAAHPMADAVLATTEAHLYFVPGNHEDHAYLGELWQSYARSLAEPVAVDRAWTGLAEGRYAEGEFAGYGRIHCLPQGPVVALQGALDEEPTSPRHLLRVHAVNGLDRYTPPGAFTSAREPVEVLLSHETYRGRLSGSDATGQRDSYGSERLLELLRAEGPRYHFFGHHHGYYPEIELATCGTNRASDNRGASGTNGAPDNRQGHTTRSVGLNQVNFESRDAIITPGCFGVLRVSAPEAMRFEIVEDDWFRTLRYRECAHYL